MKYDSSRVQFPVYVQPKLNGIRALVNLNTGTVQSRRGEFWQPAMVKRFVQDLQRFPDLKYPVVDGEFYVHGWSLQRIAAAMTVIREQPTEDSLLMEYHIYDCVGPKAYNERHIETGLSFVSVHSVDTLKVYTHADLDAAHNRWLSQGYEGSMIRIPSAPYIHNKTEALISARSGKISRSW